MTVLARFTRILIACLMAVALSAGAVTVRADGHDAASRNTVADCVSQQRIDGGHKHPSNYQIHCCSIAHCWVAAEIDAPPFVIAAAGLRVGDLTNTLNVGPATNRLDRPPQVI
ncbi:hypothetical protein [Phyllobacterium endophyticum]|nr:hypothetical protein [Phyllobacterium endophyticum]MBB3237846.1 hypothetical protein [Phyllobacterium endophyticum]TYR42457.1 hypothetical protein FY050_14780 [Phyllobacterium endophyticum]